MFLDIPQAILTQNISSNIHSVQNIHPDNVQKWTHRALPVQVRARHRTVKYGSTAVAVPYSYHARCCQPPLTPYRNRTAPSPSPSLASGKQASNITKFYLPLVALTILFLLQIFFADEARCCEEHLAMFGKHRDFCVGSDVSLKWPGDERYSCTMIHPLTRMQEVFAPSLVCPVGREEEAKEQEQLWVPVVRLVRWSEKPALPVPSRFPAGPVRRPGRRSPMCRLGAESLQTRKGNRGGEYRPPSQISLSC
ncbi:hypothetical protein C8F01DRAFT_1095724 [Mycena amicta]|nr:hypothetical protein C8F01DRAFT_1095724 [Mycena amicta]